MSRNKHIEYLLKLFKEILAVILILSVFFLFLEQLSRCYLFGLACFNYKKMSTLSALGVSGLIVSSNYPEIMFEYKPNIDTYNKLARFKTNSQGLRDKEYSLKKPENTFRAVIVGGSYTAAEGVTNEENYHTIIEDRLNRNASGISYEFINFAVGAYHLNQKIAALKYKALKYEPDMILLALGSSVFRVREKIGDAEFEKYKNSQKSVQNSFFECYALKLFRMNRLFHADDAQQTEKEVYSEKDITRLDYFFKELKDIGEARNIPVVIMVIEHDYTHINTNRQTMSLISKYGFHSVTTIDAFKDKNFLDYIIYKLDKHPNVAAHKIFADVIYNYLTMQSLLRKSDSFPVQH